MSGSGGYSKYRCKYFSSHGCLNWVYQMRTACIYCVAAGRYSVDLLEQSFTRPREVCMPVVHQGTITYAIFSVGEAGQPGSSWNLRYETTQQPLMRTIATMPTITTSDTSGIALAPTDMCTNSGYQF